MSRNGKYIIYFYHITKTLALVQFNRIEFTKNKLQRYIVSTVEIAKGFSVQSTFG